MNNEKREKLKSLEREYRILVDDLSCIKNNLNVVESLLQQTNRIAFMSNKLKNIVDELVPIYNTENPDVPEEFFLSQMEHILSEHGEVIYNEYPWKEDDEFYIWKHKTRNIGIRVEVSKRTYVFSLDSIFDWNYRKNIDNMKNIDNKKSKLHEHEYCTYSRSIHSIRKNEKDNFLRFMRECEIFLLSYECMADAINRHLVSCDELPDPYAFHYNSPYSEVFINAPSSSTEDNYVQYHIVSSLHTDLTYFLEAYVTSDYTGSNHELISDRTVRAPSLDTPVSLQTIRITDAIKSLLEDVNEHMKCLR